MGPRPCAIALCACAVAAAGCGGSSHSPSVITRERASATAPAPTGRWVQLAAGGRTMTARGKPYAFWVRRGSPRRLMLFFEGGGGCFDYRSCRPGTPWFDDAIGPDDDPTRMPGLLDLDDPANPVHGWTAVFIPSTTGDVHWGDARHVYRSGRRGVAIEHRGFVDGMAAVAWAVANVPAPATVLVAGCSAGSIGSAAFAPYVAERYPRARIGQLGDSLAFAWPRPSDLSDWGVERHWPRWIPAARRLDPSHFRMSDYYAAIAAYYPRVTFAQIDHVADAVQTRFFVALGGRGQDFPAALMRSLRAIRQAAPNFRSVVLPGRGPCVLPTAAFDRLRVGGTSLGRWVADLLAGRPVPNLGRR